jgi:uncharacterized protein YdhG (YjbR/CyaY superfamily)
MYKKTSSANVEEYIHNTPMPQRNRLLEIYKLIQNTLPVREEKISYDMPAIMYKGKVLLYFAAQNQHIGLYALPETNVHFADSLKPYKTGKGSIQFPNNKELPLDLISKIIHFRIEAIESMSV